MAIASRSKAALLFIGDLFFFVFALWIALFVRSLEFPTAEVFYQHLVPFSFLFIVWLGVFFIAGLYENRSIILARRALSQTLLVAQGINVVIAALFFFFVPAFGIAPKTILFIYLAASFTLILLWRAFLYPRLGVQRRETTLVVGEGRELDELIAALSFAHRAPIFIAERFNPNSAELARDIESAVARHGARFIIADFNDPRVAKAFSRLYNLIFKGARFFDAFVLYEEVFGRVALSHVDDRWIARNVSRYAHTFYDPIKRVMDIVLGIFASMLSLPFYPLIMSAIIIESGFPIFIRQARVGQDGSVIYLHKFRSMERNDTTLSERPSDNKVTRVGRFIRTTRLDELPQLWDVVRGDLSLIGPRPELPAGVALYERKIPYYGVRHLIKPGLSGWAQLYHDTHPHHAADVAATREKFSYDLYYLKRRSLLLDAIIALKTIKKLLTRSGV